MVSSPKFMKTNEVRVLLDAFRGKLEHLQDDMKQDSHEQVGQLLS